MSKSKAELVEEIRALKKRNASLEVSVTELGEEVSIHLARIKELEVKISNSIRDKDAFYELYKDERGINKGLVMAIRVSNDLPAERVGGS